MALEVGHETRVGFHCFYRPNGVGINRPSVGERKVVEEAADDVQSILRLAAGQRCATLEG